MINKDRADKIRLAIMALSDNELINFDSAAYAGEDVEGEPFESAAERIKRVSAELEQKMPF